MIHALRAQSAYTAGRGRGAWLGRTPHSNSCLSTSVSNLLRTRCGPRPATRGETDGDKWRDVLKGIKCVSRAVVLGTRGYVPALRDSNVTTSGVVAWLRIEGVGGESVVASGRRAAGPRSAKRVPERRDKLIRFEFRGAPVRQLERGRPERRSCRGHASMSATHVPGRRLSWVSSRSLPAGGCGLLGRQPPN